MSQQTVKGQDTKKSEVKRGNTEYVLMLILKQTFSRHINQ